MSRTEGTVFYGYSDEQDGQIAAGTVTSPWFDIQDGREVMLQGVFAGGTTTLEVEQSRDGVTVDAAKTGITSASIVDGVKVNVAYRFVRVKIVQTVATTTNAELSVKVTT